MPLSEKASNLVSELARTACARDWHFELSGHFRELEIDATDYVRFAYSRRCFDPQPLHRGNIAVFLEYARQNNQELFLELQRAGFLAGPGDELDLLDFLTSAGLSRLGTIPVDSALLELLLSASQDANGALEMYVASTLPLDEILSELLKQYLLSRMLHPEASELLMAHLLHSHDYYHSLQTLKGAMLLRLEKEAVKLKLLSRPVSMTAAARAALEELELSPEVGHSFSEIKSQYRTLLKQYHPDHNASGQEKTMALIQAYAILCIEYEQSAT